MSSEESQTEIYIQKYCRYVVLLFWRKIVTVPTFIFRHFSPKTLTNINTQPTHPRNNIYLRRQNK